MPSVAETTPPKEPLEPLKTEIKELKTEIQKRKTNLTKSKAIIKALTFEIETLKEALGLKQASIRNLNRSSQRVQQELNTLRNQRLGRQ